MNILSEYQTLFLKFLQIIQFPQDKIEFVNNITRMCLQDSFFDATDTLSEEQKKQFGEEASHLTMEDSMQKLQEILSHYFTPEKYQQFVKNRMKETIYDFILSMSETASYQDIEDMKACAQDSSFFINP